MIPMTGPGNKRLLAALEANWQAEMEGHHTYTAFAKDEVDPQRRNALRGLAAAERHHADLWAGRIQELGAPAPQYTGHPSGQAGSFANRVGGADLALRRLEINEARDIYSRWGLDPNDSLLLYDGNTSGDCRRDCFASRAFRSRSCKVAYNNSLLVEQRIRDDLDWCARRSGYLRHRQVLATRNQRSKLLYNRLSVEVLVT
jgi:hypothetical protein